MTKEPWMTEPDAIALYGVMEAFKERAKYLKAFSHVFIRNGNDARCKACGLDFGDAIHKQKP